MLGMDAEKIQQWGKATLVAFSVCGALYGGLKVFKADLGVFATDEDIEAHDKNEIAHPRIRSKTDDLRDDYISLLTRVKTQQEALETIGAELVSFKAADKEPNRAWKAASATYHRLLFKELIRQGVPIDKAVDQAAEAPWRERPHL